MFNFFSLETKLRKESFTERSQIYGHLAHVFSCNKITLVNRAKKLCIQHAENKVKEPLDR